VAGAERSKSPTAGGTDRVPRPHPQGCRPGGLARMPGHARIRPRAVVRLPSSACGRLRAQVGQKGWELHPPLTGGAPGATAVSCAGSDGVLPSGAFTRALRRCCFSFWRVFLASSLCFFAW
jgi:hypothetical protein